MNFDLYYKGFEKNLYLIEELNGGQHYLFKFDNGYGASIVKHSFSYGHDEDLWELAVIKFDEPSDDVVNAAKALAKVTNVIPNIGCKWHLTYDTPITDDVLGYLTNIEVTELLERIKNLCDISTKEEEFQWLN